MFNRITIVVNDYEKSVEFYNGITSFFGDQVLNKEEGVTIYGPNWESTTLVVVKNFQGKKIQPSEDISISFLANSHEQLKAAYEKLLSLGAKDIGNGIGPKSSYPHYHSVVMTDPSGFVIEVGFHDCQASFAALLLLF